MPSSPEPQSDRSAGQLLNAWLDSVEFEANPEYVADGRVVRYHLDFKHAISVHEEGNRAVVGLTIKVGWRDAEDQELTPPHPFRLELAVAGLFEWERAEVDRDTFEAWLEWNGVYLLWPYARSYITSLTAASPVPPLTIYTLRVPDPPSKKAAEVVATASPPGDQEPQEPQSSAEDAAARPQRPA